MPGFGLSPVGSSPFGFGSSDAAPLPPLVLGGARFINPVTRGYEMDPDTRELKRMHEVTQRVYLLVATLQGSSSVLPKMGTRMPKRIDENFADVVRNEVAVAIQPAVADGSISYLGTDVILDRPGRVLIQVNYINRRRGEQETVEIG